MRNNNRSKWIIKHRAKKFEIDEAQIIIKKSVDLLFSFFDADKKVGIREKDLAYAFYNYGLVRNISIATTVFD